MKPKLLLHPDKWSNATSPFLESLFDEYFERVFIDDSKTYDSRECIVFCHSIADRDWLIPWRDNGFKVVIDNTWENDVDVKPMDGTEMLQSGPWFYRANESLWYKSLGYDQYRRSPSISKDFLMLINRKRHHREMLFDRVDVSNSLYSYHGRGIKLNHSDLNVQEGEFQRFFNPDWYDITNYSLVVESKIIEENLKNTEKSYKPIAFYHPYLIWGTPNLVQDLKDQGFMSFDHVIDESYDKEKDHEKRLTMLLEQVDRLRTIQLTDYETNRRAKHNHDLFFDTKWSKEQFKKNLFFPLLEILG